MTNIRSLVTFRGVLEGKLTFFSQWKKKLIKQFEATWSETPRPGWSSEAAGVGVGCGVLGGVVWGDLGDEACLFSLYMFYYICTTHVYLGFPVGGYEHWRRDGNLSSLLTRHTSKNWKKKSWGPT